MGANRYSCGISLGAILAALMAKKGHKTAFFHHFLAFLVIVLGVVTTVMNALGIETLVTQVGRWYGVIFALSRYLSGPGVVQKWVFWGSKSGLYGWLFPG